MNKRPSATTLGNEAKKTFLNQPETENADCNMDNTDDCTVSIVGDDGYVCFSRKHLMQMKTFENILEGLS